MVSAIDIIDSVTVTKSAISLAVRLQLDKTVANIHYIHKTATSPAQSVHTLAMESTEAVL